MKKILLVVVLAVSLFSCRKSKEGEFILDGTLKAPDGKFVVLNRQDDSLGLVPIDTTKLKDGKFTFTGKATEPGMHLIQVLGDQKVNCFVIIESGDITAEVDKDSIQKNKVGGTYNNNELQSFSDEANAITKKMADFQKKNEATFALAKTKNDTATMSKLKKEFGKINDEMKDHAFKYIENNPKAFISALLIKTMFNEFEPDLPKIQKYYDGLDKELQNTKVGKSILKTIKFFKTADVGRRAPDFSAPNPEGKTVSLKESLGRVTIVDFWASWCGPCMKEAPNMVAIYNEFHDKGLNIIGVSLDDNAADWKDAIAKHNLSWTQISNLKRWKDPIALSYGVDAIPSTFVVNQFGVIVAKGLTGEALKSKINELMNVK